MTNEQIWQAVLGEMEISLSKANFVTWFKDTFISSFSEELVVVGVPNAFVKKWLEEKYHKNILGALEKVTQQRINKIDYRLENKKQALNQNIPQVSVVSPVNASTNIEECQKENSSTKNVYNRFGLNPKYVFENFVVGKNNELAYAACQAVVRNLGKAYNPLFIYGGVGLGKTHLLQAIGNEASKFTGKILYTTSEKFTNNYIQAVQTGKGKDFKNLYRNVDLLLVDDVQFMGGKDGTQEEFFHTFNALHMNGKQVILTSDRKPSEIDHLEDRLVSRFMGGLTVDIQLPDYEMRVAIINQKIEEKAGLFGLIKFWTKSISTSSILLAKDWIESCCSFPSISRILASILLAKNEEA